LGDVLTLRWRTYLLVGATLLAAMIVVYVVSQTVFMRGFANVENTQMQDQVKRAQAAIAQNLAELDTDVYSYASWDDTVTFIETGDQAYIDSNLPESFYTGYKANVGVFVKNDGTIVYGQGYDLEKGQLIAMPVGLGTYLTPDSPLVRHPTLDSKTSGILMLPEGPMLVSSQPILTSNSEGPVQGAVIIGRWLDAARVAGLSAQTLLSLNLLPADAPGLPADVKEAVVSSASSGNAVVVRSDARTVAGYTMLADVFGQPALVLRVATIRDVYAQGSASVRYFIYALIGIVLVFGAATSLVLEQSVLRRLTRLTAAVRGVRSGEGKLNPIMAKGKDEISALAQTIDSGFFELETMREELENKHQELVRSEGHFRALIENSSDLIAVMDANGIMLFQSPSSERILGYRAEELEGKNAFDFLHPGDMATSQRAFVELMRNEWDPSHMLETRFRHKDGSWRTLEMMGKRLDGPSGEPRCVLNSRDVTERRQAEDERQALEHQLQQSQKMEAVGQLAGGIAHDFNNLLTAILGYSDLILASGATSLDEVRPDIEEIKHAGKRASALTQQILAFSRRQILRPAALSLNAVLEGMEPLLRRTLGEDIDLVTRTHLHLDLTEVDRHQFEQVLMNLALNARDAMPSGGRLTLATTNVELDEECCRAHPEIAPGPYVMLSVSDTGLGMDEGILDHIFEPFFTTKAPGAGTGLGLATVYGIVRQSNGSIFVESEPGRGTTFKIYLPRSVQSRIPDEIIVPPREPATGSETVMVVEDEAALRSLMDRILGEAGYTTLSFGSAAEALEALERGEYSIDLLLTDVMLPGALQGHDLARTILAAWPDLPVLYISGYSRDALTHAGRLDEGVNLLEKPFTPETLAARVRQVLDQPHIRG
jgi:PAS domain S-box-containing protein